MCNINIREANELEYFSNQIFISHCGDKYLEELEEELKKDYLQYNKINSNYTYDKKILHPGTNNYKEKIEEALDNCYMCILIVTKKALKSDWVQYEIGRLSARNIKIIAYNPENLCIDYIPSIESCKEPNDVVNSAKKIFPFGKTPFKNIVNVDTNNITPTILELTSDKLAEYYHYLKKCSVNLLLVGFGKDETNNADNNKEEECAILNSIIEGGKVESILEKDTSEKTTPNLKLSVNLPVHNDYGTEFKIVIDAPDKRTQIELKTAFDKAGLNPTFSSSYNDFRIYLSIPENSENGFKIKQLPESYNNNYVTL